MARLTFDLSVLRVLLVQDDTFSRELEKTALQQLGVGGLTIARDWAEALDILKRVRCDLLISDWSMPGLEGTAFIRDVRAGWPGLPVLMLTSNDGLDQISMARDAGVDGCLIRPFSLAKLREAVQLALISKLTGGAPLRATPDAAETARELSEVATTIEGAIAPVRDVSPVADPSLVTLTDTHRLARQVSGQLQQFLRGLTDVQTTHITVIQLHVDCMAAILSGHQDMLEHETQNAILDGLNFAADLAGDGRG